MARPIVVDATSWGQACGASCSIIPAPAESEALAPDAVITSPEMRIIALQVGKPARRNPGAAPHCPSVQLPPFGGERSIAPDAGAGVRFRVGPLPAGHIQRRFCSGLEAGQRAQLGRQPGFGQLRASQPRRAVTI